MVKNFRPEQREAVINGAAKEQVESDDILDTDLNPDNFRPVFTVQSTRTEHYAPGWGSRNLNLATGYSDFDAQDSSGSAVSGSGRWVLYASDLQEDPLYKGGSFSLSDLRSAVAESRTDKVPTPLQRPRGSQDRVLAFEMKTKSSTVTVSASNSNSNVGMAYSRIEANR